MIIFLVLLFNILGISYALSLFLRAYHEGIHPTYTEFMVALIWLGVSLYSLGLFI